VLAYVVTAPDAPPEFRNVPKPTVGSNDVLVRIQASSINPVDAMVAAGYFSRVQEHHYPTPFGRDLSGVVEQVGDAVTAFEVGQSVWGFVKRPYVGDGTFAEYVALPEDRYIVPKLETQNVVDAGAMGLASVTALDCLDALGLSKGQTVLVNQATGGVGAFAIQIAAARELRVIATARAGDAESFVRGLGANEVIDWTSGNVAAAVRQLCPGGVDGLVDLVRRDSVTHAGMDISQAQRKIAEFAASVLSPTGKFTSTINEVSPELIASGVGFNVHSWPEPARFAVINELVAEGAVHTPVTATFPFAEIEAAFRHQQSNGRGKTALSME
jgi:NADPH:quinone reductase-like Zn-dependent oxidoreductase